MSVGLSRVGGGGHMAEAHLARGSGNGIRSCGCSHLVGGRGKGGTWQKHTWLKDLEMASQSCGCSQLIGGEGDGGFMAEAHLARGSGNGIRSCGCSQLGGGGGGGWMGGTWQNHTWLGDPEMASDSCGCSQLIGGEEGWGVHGRSTPGSGISKWQQVHVDDLSRPDLDKLLSDIDIGHKLQG